MDLAAAVSLCGMAASLLSFMHSQAAHDAAQQQQQQKDKQQEEEAEATALDSKGTQAPAKPAAPAQTPAPVPADATSQQHSVHSAHGVHSAQSVFSTPSAQSAHSVHSAQAEYGLMLQQADLIDDGTEDDLGRSLSAFGSLDTPAAASPGISFRAGGGSPRGGSSTLLEGLASLDGAASPTSSPFRRHVGLGHSPRSPDAVDASSDGTGTPMCVPLLAL